MTRDVLGGNAGTKSSGQGWLDVTRPWLIFGQVCCSTVIERKDGRD